MPRHTKTQAPTGESIPGRITRVRLDGTNYLTYSPELLCRLTEWHHLRGAACQHSRAQNPWRWPCESCGAYWVQDSKRTLQNTLQNPARRIALVPWPKASYGSSGPEDSLEREGGVKNKIENLNWYSPVAASSSSGHDKKKQLRRVRLKNGKSLLDVVQKNTSQRGKDPKGLRFAHFMPGQDDPVEAGRDMAFSGEVLPSDGIWRVGDGSGAGVRLGTEEEKELADLRKQGVLKDVVDGEEGVLTMDSIVRGDEPAYRVRLVQRKKKGGKGKGRTVAVQAEREGSEERAASDASCDVVADGVVAAARDDDQTLELLPQEVIDAMPDYCWAGFFADLEAEGWVPVIEDDLASVAESWVVMESESEDSDGKT
ncbi:hypothetical protein QBC37DRAFT_434367 [Rhypophila decipiens]|uniref:Uncharacterized protein n=1 Tax=Rhypophila decipiens TaxID=261697 RepID=A0AAN6XUG3_9PEZI|nr:hypothetical protein QBC37DRAFT_434367 [Rhypophila decipiens]